jgi:hypothetical protein
MEVKEEREEVETEIRAEKQDTLPTQQSLRIRLDISGVLIENFLSWALVFENKNRREEQRRAEKSREEQSKGDPTRRVSRS